MSGETALLRLTRHVSALSTRTAGAAAGVGWWGHASTALLQSGGSCGSIDAENVLVMVDQELDGIVLRMHVVHLAVAGAVAHEGWSKDDGEVAGGHEVLFAAVGDAGEVEDDELENLAVDFGELVDDGLDGKLALGFVVNV